MTMHLSNPIPCEQLLRIVKWQLFLALVVLSSATPLRAQMLLPTIDVAAIQNFNGMGTSATATLPTGFKIGTDWATGTTATTQAAGTSGTGAFNGTSAGGAYNAAQGVTGTSTDRSLGFLTSGNGVTGYSSPRSIILRLQNNTGQVVGSLDLAWNYEKYRSGTRQIDWSFYHGATSAPTTADGNGDHSYPSNANNTVISNPPLSTSRTFTISDLSIEPGGSYYLMWTYTGLNGHNNAQALTIDDLSITPHVPPPPINDDCSSPIALYPTSYSSCPASAATVSTVSATPSPASCTGTAPDIWYDLITSTEHTIVSLTGITATGAGVEVFATPMNDCGDGTSVYCGSGAFHVIPTPSGQSYMMRLYSATAGTISMCVSTPIENDLCDQGVYLGGAQPYGTCTPTSGTSIGSTPSGGSCGATNDDVWYYFSAPGGVASFIDLTSTGAAGLGLEVFSDQCGGGSVYCGSGVTHTVPTVASLTYWVRVFSTTPGGFTICVSSAQANDVCDNAAYLGGAQAFGTCTPTAGTTGGALPSGGSCGASNDDVWYYFSSTTGSASFVNLMADGASGLGIEVLEDACTGMSLYCGTGNTHTVPTIASHNYWVRVFSTSPGGFNICINASQTNDECDQSTYLGGAQAYGTCTPTAGTTDGVTPSGGSCEASNVDAWFYFTSSTGSASFVNLEADGASGLGIEVLEDICTGTSVYCGTGNAHTIPTTSGLYYWVRVFSTTPGGFNICVSASQTNDECDQATYLGGAQPYSTCSSTAGTTEGTTPSGGSCGSTSTDAWFYFTSTTGSSSFVNIDANVASGFGIEVLENTCTGASVYCSTGQAHTVPTTPGQYYWVRVFSTTPDEFMLCINATQANDECDNSTYLSYAQAFDACSPTTGTTAGTTPSGGSCSALTMDAWFYFNAAGGTSSFVDLVPGTASGLGIEVLEVTCTGTSVYCGGGTAHVVPTIPNEYYWVRVYSTTPGDFTICASQPVGNDECNAAVSLGNGNAEDCASNAVIGTTSGATPSGGSCGATNNDVWYYFYSGSSLNALVDLDAVTATGLGIEVFEDACGGASTYCGSGTDHAVPTIPGHYYYMRVFSSTDGEFSVCVSNIVQPGNDECGTSQYITLHSDGDCPSNATNGTTLGASNSGGSCNNTLNDVWYYFYGSASLHTTIQLNAGSASGLGIEVYSDPNSDCTGSSFYCATGLSHGVPTSSGQLYRVRVYSTTPGDFTICLSAIPQPANDECVSSQYLGVQNAADCPANAANGTTVGASSSGGGCNNTLNDVWYYFYASNSLHTTIQLTEGTASGLSIEVYDDANSDCSGTSIYCAAGLSHTVPTVNGQLYRVRVYSSTSGDFSICPSAIPQPGNDACEGQSYLGTYAYGDCPSNASTGTTLGASSSGGTCGSGLNDVWYYFTANTANTHIDLSAISASGIGIEVYHNATSCPEITSFYCSNGTQHTVPTIPGQYHHVRVFASTPGEFSICVSQPPTNDDCTNAFGLNTFASGECPDNNYPGTTLGATAAGGSCSSGNADVWYSFYSYPHVFNYVHLEGDGASGLGIEVFDACEGNSVYCGTGADHLVPVTPNTNMYMRVYSTTPGSFNVCVNRPPDNDECGSAVPLNYFTTNSCPDEAIAGSTVGATFNGGTCGSGAADVWYALYYATNNGVVVNLSSTGATGLGIEAFDACGGNSIYCGTGTHHVITGFNTWTYLRVYSSGPGSFTICTSPAAENNECAYALPLTLNLQGECPDNAVEGTTTDAGASGTVSCNAGPLGDVWYYIYSNDGTAMHLDLTATGAAGLGLQVFDACGGNSVYCANGTSHDFLVQTHTYYRLKVYSTTPGDFTICATQADGAEDCMGVPGGPALPGTLCDDDEPLTINDQYQIDCQCIGYDCLGILGGTTGPGTPCLVGYSIDGTPYYGAYDVNCQCAWTDCEEVANGNAYPGQTCDDGVAATPNSYWNSACECSDYYDCAGTLNGPLVIGSPCLVSTDQFGVPFYGTRDANCNCSWTDCEQVANGNAYPGQPCDDGVAVTPNSYWSSACECSDYYDCNGVLNGPAVIGTPCLVSYDPLGVPFYGSLDANCNCSWTDCEEEANGNTYPGSPCDDGETSTTSDTYAADCECRGYDCNGVYGGTAYLDNCNVCVGGNTGVIPCVQDCNGVYGGTAYLDNCNVCVGGNTGITPRAWPSRSTAPSRSWRRSSLRWR